MVPEGVIVGGWNFVIAGYSITIIGLTLFAWNLRSRLKSSDDEDRDD